MISVHNLTPGYSGTEVLHGISFRLGRGENLSVIGPNGCGKTTLLRAIAGTLPYTGEVMINHVNIRGIKRKELARKISMLSQISQIYFNYTVYDTIMFGRYVHESDGIFGGNRENDKLAVLSALKKAGVENLHGRYINTLSGGQLQRVFLAKIIAQNPDIVLLDEPTNHLDLSFQVELIRFLKEWSVQDGKTIIGVLHDVNLAMLLTDNVLLMDNGNIKAQGKCSDIYSSDVLTGAYNMDVAAYMLETLKKWETICSRQ